MGRPLKILFLLEDLCYGGTQKQSLALATLLDRNKFDPFILTLTGPTDLDDQALAAGVPVYHMNSTRKVDPLFFAGLGKRIRSMKPDIIVPCTALPNIWGRIWGKLLGTSLIVGTCRGGGAPARQHEWILWRLADGIVCNTPVLVEEMARRGADRKKLVYIANGVDTEHFRPGPEKSGAPLIVCVARLARDKDHATLLEAFDRLGREFDDVRLCLVGDGPEEQRLREFCRSSMSPHVAGRVQFVGACADPAPWYAHADMFALASVREGQPNALLEAMSAALPVCATSVGGIPDLVGSQGLLGPSRDAEILAQNMATLLRDRPRASRMGQAARERVKRDFSFHAMVRKHEEFFLRLWHNGANEA